MLNSAALDALGLLDGEPKPGTPAGVEREAGKPTGRLYECDAWLRNSMGSRIPALGPASQQLASYGVSGITDTTPRNGLQEWHHFAQAQQDGSLRQDVRMMGSLELADPPPFTGMQRGEFKIHLLESQLPEVERMIADICAAHEGGRNIAIHCVTLTELVFAVSCLDAAGVVTGDRIEHASVASPEMVA